MPKLNVNWSELQACWEDIRDSGMFTEGKYVRLLEDAVSDWCGMEAVVYNSAGTGLYGMLRMSGIVFDNVGPVAVQNNTFYATGASARECGREVLLVDCRRDDFSMDLGALPKRRVGTLILTHVGGSLAKDYHRIADHCLRYDVTFFEDAAHAFGVGEAGHTAGWHSDGAVFSLYPTKAIPAGEGGVIVTRHSLFAERLREFRNYGKYKGSDGTLKYRSSGFNFRMDEWTAAIAWLQVKRRKEILEKRQQAAYRLSTVIEPMFGMGTDPGSNWYKYPVLASQAKELGIKKFTGKIYQRSDQLVAALGISRQGAFPDSEWIADNHVCLPLDEGMYEGMSKDNILAYLRS